VGKIDELRSSKIINNSNAKNPTEERENRRGDKTQRQVMEQAKRKKNLILEDAGGKREECWGLRTERTSTLGWEKTPSHICSQLSAALRDPK